MAMLTLHRKQLFKLSIPYWVFINEHPIGIMQGHEVNIQMPGGVFDVKIKILFKLFKWQFHIGGSTTVNLSPNEQVHFYITDKERWWNILFDIDLMVWLAKFFFELPNPWDTTYEIISNGFFVIWIARIWMIHNRYFIIIIKRK